MGGEGDVRSVARGGENVLAPIDDGNARHSPSARAERGREGGDERALVATRGVDGHEPLGESGDVV